MLENYSLGDLFANVFKNIKKNIILLIILFIVFMAPFAMKAKQAKPSETAPATNSSTYISYGIQSDKAHINEDGEYVEPFTSFFYNLIYSNTNGAYIFENVDEKVIQKISDELSVDKTQLRNADARFWDGKIVVMNSSDNGTVNVQILTSSPEFNKLVEEKIDALVNESVNYLDNVNIEKLNSYTTTELSAETERQEANVSGMIVKGIIIAGIGALFIVLFLNFVLYVFNPTMNGVFAFEKYKIDFVYDYAGVKELNNVLKYFEDNGEKVTIMTTSDKVKQKIKREDAKFAEQIMDINDINAVLNSQSILFVEEYGVTRYKDFEKALRQANNFDKKVVGAVCIPL